MVHRRAKSVEVLPFLKKVRGDEHKGIPRHSELTHEGLVHLAGHSTHGLLVPEKLSEQPGCLAKRFRIGVGEIDVENERMVLGDIRKFVEGTPAPLSQGACIWPSRSSRYS